MLVSAYCAAMTISLPSHNLREIQGGSCVGGVLVVAVAGGFELEGGVLD
jgi:hypothetical protein